MKKFLTVVIIVLTATTVFAGRYEEMQKLLHRRTSSTFAQGADIPYVINNNGFVSGVNIAVSSKTPMVLSVGFFHGLNIYAVNQITIPSAGWTGLATELLPAGVTFESPSQIYLSMDCGFDVSEFLISPFGFSHTSKHSIYVH